MDMAKKAKHKKLTLTEKYERRRVWAGYFGITLKAMKRATKKALKLAEKLIKQKRLELKDEGVTDIPTVAQVYKYEKQTQQLSNKEEREELPYAEANETPFFNETEDIINSFMETMQATLSEAIQAYGLSQPWRAKSFEQQILDIMSKFNEARDKYGDELIAQKIADSLDYQQIVTVIAYDYDEATEMLDNMSSVFDGILDSWM